MRNPFQILRDFNRVRAIKKQILDDFRHAPVGTGIRMPNDPQWAVALQQLLKEHPGWFVVLHPTGDDTISVYRTPDFESGVPNPLERQRLREGGRIATAENAHLLDPDYPAPPPHDASKEEPGPGGTKGIVPRIFTGDGR